MYCTVTLHTLIKYCHIGNAINLQYTVQYCNWKESLKNGPVVYGIAVDSGRLAAFLQALFTSVRRTVFRNLIASTAIKCLPVH